MKFQNLRKFWIKIQKIGIFFNQMFAQGVTHHASKTRKTLLSRLFTPYKAYIYIFGLIIASNRKK